MRGVPKPFCLGGGGVPLQIFDLPTMSNMLIYLPMIINEVTYISRVLPQRVLRK